MQGTNETSVFIIGEVTGFFTIALPKTAGNRRKQNVAALPLSYSAETLMGLEPMTSLIKEK
jgi:hypothetical protein